MAMSTKQNPDSFRDFASEAVISDKKIRIYSLSLSASSADCGQDCHAVCAYIVNRDEEIELGEVLDSGDDANAKIAALVKAAR